MFAITETGDPVRENTRSPSARMSDRDRRDYTPLPVCRRVFSPGRLDDISRF